MDQPAALGTGACGGFQDITPCGMISPQRIPARGRNHADIGSCRMRRDGDLPRHPPGSGRKAGRIGHREFGLPQRIGPAEHSQ
jgi:hypothetical protein